MQLLVPSGTGIGAWDVRDAWGVVPGVSMEPSKMRRKQKTQKPCNRLRCFLFFGGGGGGGLVVGFFFLRFRISNEHLSKQTKQTGILTT